MQHLDDGTLQEWLDRERSGIEDARAEEVTRHVAGCAPCRARAAELRALTEATESLLTADSGAAAAEPDFGDVLARARGRPRARRRTFVALGRAATVALALGAGWLTNELVRSGRVTSDAESGVTSAPPAAADAGPVPASEPAPAETAQTNTPAAVEPAPAQRARAEEAAPEITAEAIVVPQPSALLPEVVTPPVAALDEAQPRPPRVVTGRVTDEAGRPLTGAQVYIAEANVGVLTGEDGTYTLLLGGGTLDTTSVLHVDLIGYASQTRALAGATGDVYATDFSLTQQALTLEEVVVTGVRAPAERRAIGNTVATADAASGGATAEVGWRRSSRSEAEALAGFALLVLPYAPLSSLQLRQVDERWVVRFVQRLPSGVEVTLTEAAGATVLDEAAGAGARPVATASKGGLSVSIAGDLPLDSLHSLLERVR